MSPGFEYFGGDIVSSVVKDNQERFREQHPNWTFQLFDMTSATVSQTSPLPLPSHFVASSQRCPPTHLPCFLPFQLLLLALRYPSPSSSVPKSLRDMWYNTQLIRSCLIG